MKKTMILAAVLAISATATADDMKKPDPAKKAPEPKKDEKKPEAMVAPKPAQELTDASKGMLGTWNCTGKMADMKDPTKSHDFKGTNKMSMDLDKFWIKGDMSMTSADMKGVTMKGTEYITYDAAAKKWTRLAMDNMGGSEWMTSADMKSWDGEMHMMGMTMKTRTKVDASAKELKVNSDMSMDGKKWSTDAFTMVCKK
jgi:hypothetical protein